MQDGPLAEPADGASTPLAERRHLRVALAAVLVVFAGLLLALADAPPTEAACGTNWSSKKEPPETILVLWPLLFSSATATESRLSSRSTTPSGCPCSS